jgi:hypothetical protein
MDASLPGPPSNNTASGGHAASRLRVDFGEVMPIESQPPVLAELEGEMNAKLNETKNEKFVRQMEVVALSGKRG